ncbi:hypothetical protein QVD17_37572 [Tagetes erecta]|uniref:Uncharacterized protein n=1 Tax=Tagetes erecta TaxID=13708 RepID=A0AAD8JW99_TARER|nr:hypothetical protein QVD17_37572 [Tagetes erecta]
MDINEDSFTYAMQLVTNIALPMVLSNVVQLKVLDVIAHAGPNARLSAHEIVSRLSISNPDAPAKLDRMLRLLASYSILTCIQSDHQSKCVRLYGLAPVAKHFIPNEDGVSLCALLELYQIDKSNIDTWFKLKDSTREGGNAVEKVHGMDGFDILGLDARLNELFNKAMVDTSTMVMKKILECYHGFNNLKRVVDVGGGLGVTLNMIISKHPTIHGINFDLPHVIQHAPLYAGIEHVEGDMFQNVPHGDGIFLKVLHSQSDEDCVKLLKNCYKALQDGGKVIVVETIVPFIPDASSSTKAATHLDVTMMSQTIGGKERTEDQFLSLAKEARFDGMRKVCFVCNNLVMEFYK